MRAKKILIAIILSFSLSAFAFAAIADTTDTGTTINFKPSVPLPGVTSETVSDTYFKDGTALGRYIIALYKFGFSIIGILATITMMYGGLLYIIAAGDSGKESEARKWITASLSGVTLMLSTYVILNFVNPDLVKMKNLSIDPISNKRETPATDDNTQVICQYREVSYENRMETFCKGSSWTFSGIKTAVNSTNNGCVTDNTKLGTGCCKLSVITEKFLGRSECATKV